MKIKESTIDIALVVLLTAFAYSMFNVAHEYESAGAYSKAPFSYKCIPANQ